jgi:hypothetical protein
MADPIYRQIADELREQIESGKSAPGNRLPTGLNLRDRRNASWNTVRDAIKWLTRPRRDAAESGHLRHRGRRLVGRHLVRRSPAGLGGGEGTTYLSEANARHRKPTNSPVRVETESRFFRLPDHGRTYVMSISRTAYENSDHSPIPFRVAFTIFPVDRNQLVINSGEVPSALAAPAEV